MNCENDVNPNVFLTSNNLHEEQLGLVFSRCYRGTIAKLCIEIFSTICCSH